MPRTVDLTRVPLRTLLAWMRENGVGERWQDIKAPPERRRGIHVAVGRRHGPELRDRRKDAPPELPIAENRFIEPLSRAQLIGRR